MPRTWRNRRYLTDSDIEECKRTRLRYIKNYFTNNNIRDL
jgi:hypothetical protein